MIAGFDSTLLADRNDSALRTSEATDSQRGRGEATHRPITRPGPLYERRPNRYRGPDLHKDETTHENSRDAERNGKR